MKKSIKRLNQASSEFAIKADIAVKRGIAALKKPLENNDGWGRDEIIAVAIALVIAAFVVVPGLRDFAETILDEADTWYSSTIKSRIFDTTP